MPTSDAKGVVPRYSKRRCNGFTLVEMVSVLIVLAILAAFVLPRFVDRSAFDARIFYDQAQSMLRHAQKIAIAQNRSVYVRLNGSNLAVCFDSACASQVPAPGGANSGSAATLASCGNATWFCEAAPNSYVAAPTFFFDALGRPFDSADIPPASTFVARLDLAISGGGSTRHIYVEPETGYVHP